MEFKNYTINSSVFWRTCRHRFSFSFGSIGAWQLAQSGWGKLHSLSDATDLFTSLNLPFPAQTAMAISCLEFFGGIFLTLGLLSRTTALVLTANMFMADVTADRQALLSTFSDPDKFSAAAPFTFLIASVIVLLFGPGKIALDAVFRFAGRNARTSGESLGLELME